VDSRIPVEDVFDLGIGDIFVARVAGNFENTDILGSMEFATRISGARLILVMGHSDCGAVHAAIDGAELGNITPMLENIQPAIDSLTDYEGERTSSNSEFAHKVTEGNIRQTMEDIRSRSPVIAEMEKNGEVQIVGALYEMSSGVVTFIH
jgi:carbonic anhydrase